MLFCGLLRVMAPPPKGTVLSTSNINLGQHDYTEVQLLRARLKCIFACAISVSGS
jgi:hypothetical protein